MVYAHSFFLVLILTTYVLDGAFAPGVPRLINSSLLSLDTLVVLAVFFGPKIRSAMVNAPPKHLSSVTLPSGLVISGLDFSSSQNGSLERPASFPVLLKDGQEDCSRDHSPPSKKEPLTFINDNISRTAIPDNYDEGGSELNDFSNFGSSRFFERGCRSSHHRKDVLSTSISNGGDAVNLISQGPALPMNEVVAMRRFSV